MRQSANSAVRFSTYSTLKVGSSTVLWLPELIDPSIQSFVQGNARPGEILPTSLTFGIGAIAGTVTVYATMPLE